VRGGLVAGEKGTNVGDAPSSATQQELHLAGDEATVLRRPRVQRVRQPGDDDLMDEVRHLLLHEDAVHELTRFFLAEDLPFFVGHRPTEAGCVIGRTKPCRHGAPHRSTRAATSTARAGEDHP